jgi:hypothetical protein
MKDRLAAISLLPSADEATASQLLLGALVCIQVWANAKSATISVAAANKRILAAFMVRLDQ